MSRFWLVLCCLIVAGCHQQPPKDAVAEYKYGPEQTFVGIWNTGMEHSGFVPCSFEEEFCKESSRQFLENGCWIDSVDSDPKRLSNLLGREPDFKTGSTYFVKFLGKETLKRGQYGHLGSYSCNIIGEKLLSIEEVFPFGPP